MTQRPKPRPQRARVALLLILAVVTGLAQPAHSRAWPDDAVPGALLVTTRSPGVLAAIPEAVPLGERIGLVRVAPGEEAAAGRRLAGVPGVVAVEPDRLRALARVPDDPEYHRQWAHRQAGIEVAWRHTTGSRRVRVALIDGGVRGDHPDLRANIAEQVDVSSGTVVAVGRGVDNDTCGLGHGTQVAGVIGAVGNNTRDVAGVAWEVSLLDIAGASARNPETCDTIPDSAVLAGMHYASTHPQGPADVINLSLGSPQGYCPEAYDTAIRAARDRGSVVVVAAGNLGPGGISVPAACPGALAVTATDRTGEVAGYASTNPWVALAAPGGSDREATGNGIVSTSADGGTSIGSGTSFAAAYVAGTVALLRTLRPELNPDEIRALLQHTAERIGSDQDMVRLRLRADRAVVHAAQDRAIPAPAPAPFFPVLRHAPPPAGPGPVRIAAGEPTDPVEQAVAVSRAVFKDGGAVHAVLARGDGFADALAGSALGYGVAPLLFTSSRGPLAGPTAAELRRVLSPGGAVYLLGGERAVPEQAENQLRELGYVPIRISGATREETAADTARVLTQRLRRLGFTPPDAAVLVTRRDWPDAITAGSLGAVYGIPILLTDAEHLHPATASVLQELRPETLFVVGGEASVSAATADEAAAAGGSTVVRLSGATRDATAVAVAERLLAATTPRYAVAVNVRRDDAYAAALAATALVGAHRAVLVPVEGGSGTTLTPATRDAVRGLRLVAVASGGRDLVSQEVLVQLQRLLDE